MEAYENLEKELEETFELYCVIKEYCAKKVETLLGMIDKREEEI